MALVYHELLTGSFPYTGRTPQQLMIQHVSTAPDLSALPPALILTAEYDPLQAEGEAYATRLRDAGVDVTVRRYDGLIHGFIRMPAVLDRSGQAIDEIAAAIAAALGRAGR